MRSGRRVGRFLVAAAIVLYFSSASAAVSLRSSEPIPPAAATRLAHRTAIGFKDLALDAVHACHRILSGGAKMYARHCAGCARFLADRVPTPRG